MLPETKALIGKGIAALLISAAVACGSGDDDAGSIAFDGGQGGADQAPSAQLQISADRERFDKDVLVATPNAPISLAFANMDTGVLHNVSIFRDSSATQPLYIGELFVGDETRTYRFQSLEPGTYYFRCDVHPDTMN